LRGHNSSAVNKIYKIFIAHFSAGSACLVSVSINISHILYPVERLYCKRPIQCLALSGVSQNFDPPRPHRPASVYPPAFGAGGGHIRCDEGVGGYFGRSQTQLCKVYSTYVSTLCFTPPPPKRKHPLTKGERKVNICRRKKSPKLSLSGSVLRIS
jgi:hypothetical protein